MAQLKAGSTVGGKVIADVDSLNALTAIVATKADSDNVAFKIESGGTFYVNPSTGSDLYDGSSTTPWATLQPVADKFNNSRIDGNVKIFMSPGNVTSSSVVFQNIITKFPFLFIGTDLDFTDPNYETSVPVLNNTLIFYNCTGSHGYAGWTGLVGEYSFPSNPQGGIFMFLGCKGTASISGHNSRIKFIKCLFNGTASGGTSTTGLSFTQGGHAHVDATCKFNGFDIVIRLWSSTAYIEACSGSNNTTGVYAAYGSFAINLASSTIGATTPNNASGGIIFKSPQVIEHNVSGEVGMETVFIDPGHGGYDPGAIEEGW